MVLDPHLAQRWRQMEPHTPAEEMLFDLIAEYLGDAAGEAAQGEMGTDAVQVAEFSVMGQQLETALRQAQAVERLAIAVEKVAQALAIGAAVGSGGGRPY